MPNSNAQPARLELIPVQEIQKRLVVVRERYVMLMQRQAAGLPGTAAPATAQSRQGAGADRLRRVGHEIGAN
jgi:hypothetical protein